MTDNPARDDDLMRRGYDGPAEAPVRQAWLDVAWRALRRELRTRGVDLDAALTAGDIDTQDVIDVVVSATLRALRNPDGLESESMSIDDYRETLRRRDASEDVYFTAAELRGLIPSAVQAADAGWSGSVKYA